MQNKIEILSMQNPWQLFFIELTRYRKQHKNIEQKIEQEETEKNLSLKNILSNIENKEVSSNYTFYLKKDNVEKLRHIAKQKNIII